MIGILRSNRCARKGLFWGFENRVAKVNNDDKLCCDAERYLMSEAEIDESSRTSGGSQALLGHHDRSHVAISYFPSLLTIITLISLQLWLARSISLSFTPAFPNSRSSVRAYTASFLASGPPRSDGLLCTVRVITRDSA